jgi:hypothetical protein
MRLSGITLSKGCGYVASATTYIVRSGDTLQRIADAYGVSTASLIQFNNLQWPYIQDSGASVASPASGNVYVTFSAAISTLFTIPVGWMVGRLLRGSTTTYRQYQSTSAIMVPVGALSAVVPVECTVTGTYGNILANQINIILTAGVVPQGSTVTNPSSFTNGVNASILGPGSVLYIPNGVISPAQQYGVVATPGTIGGSDLAVDYTSGDLILGPDGDYAVSAGLDNIINGIISRLITNYGDLVNHPTYGTELMQVATGPTEHRAELMKLSITESLSGDPEVASVGTMKFTQVGTNMYVEIPVTLSTGQTVPVSVPIG